MGNPRTAGRTAKPALLTTREPWVTTDDAAEHIGKPTSWLYAKAERLGIPRCRVGQHYRYRLSQLDAWMERQAADL